MNNLLEETKEILKENNKSFDDVIWCGSESFGWFGVDKFKELADIEYDSGYGGQEIAKDLLLVGKDFWLERGEYDGSEWWEYRTTPEKPEKHTIPSTLRNGDPWATLEEMNRESGKYQ